MRLYKTVAAEASGEHEVQRSRFIAHICPVTTREEADEFYARIRKQYRDARHNVPALVLGDKFQMQWASDDGEPQGTSGAPMVQMLVSEEITNVAVMVTRYFGGIKLGTGGLVRAYTAALKAGLDAACMVEIRDMHEFKVRMDYSCLAKMQNLAAAGRFIIEDTAYEDMVVLTLICEPEEAENVRNTMADVSQGKYVLISENTCEKKVEI